MSVSPLISATQAVLTSLVPHATELVRMATLDFKEDLKTLHKRLTMIEALLSDAENRKIESELLKLWLKNLKLGLSDAENVVDDIAYDSLRSKLEIRKRDKISNFFSPSNPLVFRAKIAYKVKNVNSLLDRICKEAIELGLSAATQIINAAIVVEHRQKTEPYNIDDSRVLGRDGDVSKLKNILIGSVAEDDLSVVAIVGMAGLGKTTLAQLLYKEQEVVSYFDEKIWICVSDDFDVPRILNEMMQSLTDVKSDTPNSEALVKKLGEILIGKKYLLVLDDVWNKSFRNWERLRNSLKEIGGCKESKIIVTTRRTEVVLAIQTSPPITHHLSELSSDDCWGMFKKRAFANGGPRENQTLVEIGKKMVAQCKGVPLAIDTLAGLLHSKQHEREWELIEKTQMWKSLANEDGILPILRLSYDHLPSPGLKQCFAFCSFFPKDFEIKRDELIWLWMSQGYLQSSSRANLEMEDLGNDYLNILLRNSLLQDVKLDQDNNVRSYKMHDLAPDVSEGSCLISKASEVKENSEVQHLKLHLEEGEGFENLKDGKKLRTLSLTGHLPKYFKYVKNIRALTLEMPTVKELPSSMRKLKHLRYFDLSKTSIQKLPNFISTLYNLQTLRLPFQKLAEIPEVFHACHRKLCIFDPENYSKLMPKMIGQLTSLQTLPFFVVGKDNNIEELGCLSQLRGTLNIYGLQHVKDKEEAEKGKVQEKLGITELGLIWDEKYGKSSVNHEDVLQGLKPGMNVKELCLENFWGRRFASWTSGDDQFLTNLVKIKLRNCFNCEQVPKLGHFPHLEEVEMIGFPNLKRIGSDFYGLDEIIFGGGSTSTGATSARVFPALRTLILRKMPQLEEWSEPQLKESLPNVATSTIEFFPRLQGVWISDCPQLKMVPGHSLSIQSLDIAIEVYTLPGFEPYCSYMPQLRISFRDSTNIAILMAELLEKTCKSLRTLSYLPNQLLDLSSLETLGLINCYDLVYINEDEEAAFDGLTSLQGLSIWGCDNLRFLPRGLLQPTLEALEIGFCPYLEMAHPELMNYLQMCRMFKEVKREISEFLLRKRNSPCI